MSNTPINTPTNAFGLSKVKHIIAVSSCKGGVGKSTVSASLVRALIKQGKKVGVLDADLYGPCMHTLLGVPSNAVVGMDEFKMLIPAEHNGIKILSFAFLSAGNPVLLRGPIVTRYLQQMLFQSNWGELDFLIVDMPPGTGDVAITIAQSLKLTGALIVSTRQELSVDVVKRGVMMFRQLNVPVLGLVENMAYFTCDSCDKKHDIFGQDKHQEIEKELGLHTVAQIPLSASQDLSTYLTDFVSAIK